MCKTRYANELLLVFYLFGVSLSVAGGNSSNATINLDGKWEMGYGRKYTGTVNVPGIHTDPSRMDPETLSLNPLAPVRVTDLSKAYKESRGGIAESLVPLVNAGKNLTRSENHRVRTQGFFVFLCGTLCILCGTLCKFLSISDIY